MQMISLESIPRRKIVGAGEGRPGQEKSPARGHPSRALEEGAGGPATERTPPRAWMGSGDTD